MLRTWIHQIALRGICIMWIEWESDGVVPSKNKEAAWIFIDRTDFSRSESKREKSVIPRREGSLIVFTDIDDDGTCTNREYALTEASIDEVAQKLGIKDGKWLVFRPPECIDEIWSEIAEKTASGKLRISAKVSTAQGAGRNHVICIYTHDYFDSKDVQNVRDKLRELGVEEVIYYKPDIYTYLDIYNGKAALRPWRYRD